MLFKAYKELRSPNTIPQGSATQTAQAWGSMDEPANALIDETSQGLDSSSIRDNALPLNPVSSVVVWQEETIPSPLKPKGSSKHIRHLSSSSKSILASKSTNLKVPSNDAQKLFNSKVSQPILQISGSKSANRIKQTSPGNVLFTSALEDVPPSSLIASSSDAADLRMKHSAFMQHKTHDKENSKLGDMTITTPKGSLGRKLTPLQKSKSVLSRAKRALSDRLSNRVGKLQRKDSKSSSSLDELTNSVQKQDKETNGRRLERRIAEGLNLGNPKIRSLTGDGNIPRKPLPVYESMKSLRHRSDSFHDPFSDHTRLKDSILSLDLAEVEVDAEGYRRSMKTSKEERLFSSIPADTCQEALQAAPQILAKHSSRFSGLVSGLAQHSATETFSSSPVDQSTPCTRTEPRPSTGTRRRLTVVARSSSMLDFSFEEPSEDELGDKQVYELSQPSPSLSLKRKTGKTNLRCSTVPASKKFKTSKSSGPTNPSSMAVAVHSNKVKNTGGIMSSLKRLRAATALGPISKSLRAFDVDRGKESLMRGVEAIKIAKIWSVPEQHLLNSNHGSQDTIFERKAKGAITVGSSERRSVSIDELQRDMT